MKLQRFRKPYTPERAYRVSVLPLACYCLCGGLFCLIFAALASESSQAYLGEFPFIPTRTGKRIFFAAIGICFLPIGVGLLYRRRWALWGLMGYLAFCTAYVIIAWAMDTLPQGWNGWVVAASMAFNLFLAWGVLHSTRPAFAARSKSLNHDGTTHTT